MLARARLCPYLPCQPYHWMLKVSKAGHREAVKAMERAGCGRKLALGLLRLNFYRTIFHSLLSLNNRRPRLHFRFRWRLHPHCFRYRYPRCYLNYTPSCRRLPANPYPYRSSIGRPSSRIPGFDRASWFARREYAACPVSWNIILPLHTTCPWRSGALSCRGYQTALGAQNSGRSHADDQRGQRQGMNKRVFQYRESFHANSANNKERQKSERSAPFLKMMPLTKKMKFKCRKKFVCASSLSDLNRCERVTWRGQILTILKANSCSIGRKSGEISPVQTLLQPISVKPGRLPAADFSSQSPGESQSSMIARRGVTETGEEPVGIHACPAGHIETCLNIDVIGGRVQHEHMEVMGDGRLGGAIGRTPPPGG